METQRFRTLTAANPPFASVYLDDSRDSVQADDGLEARWRELRRELEEGCRDERIIVEVADTVLHSEPAVGRQVECRGEEDPGSGAAPSSSIFNN